MLSASFIFWLSINAARDTINVKTAGILRSVIAKKNARPGSSKQVISAGSSAVPVVSAL
jgi:hypothetical protein